MSSPLCSGTRGEPRPELFLADSLHMTRAGYLLWRGVLPPLVHQHQIGPVERPGVRCAREGGVDLSNQLYYYVVD